MAKTRDPWRTKNEIRRLSKVRPADVRRVLDRMAEASPELAGMAMAEAVDSREDGKTPGMRDEASLGVQRVSFLTTYKGIFRAEGGPHPYFCYVHLSRRPDGASKQQMGGAPLRMPAMLRRVERELRAGDEVRITIETDWDAPDLAKTLARFTKLRSR